MPAKVTVLFVTGDDVAAVQNGPEMQLIQHGLESKGAKVVLLSWTDPRLRDVNHVASYTHVTFFQVVNYNLNIKRFIGLINKSIIPATKLNPAMRVLNDCSLTLWNHDKTYLHDLEQAGFPVSNTRVFHQSDSSTKEIIAFLNNLPDGQKVVLKPSVSASARSTHLVRDAHSLTPSDEDFIATFFQSESVGSLLIQDFEKEISSGELSIMFINGRFTHAILKIPAEGNFISTAAGCQYVLVPVADVPKSALKVAAEVVEWMEKKFDVERKGESSRKLNYARIDGIPRTDGSYVLMEVEAIEPVLGFRRSTAENREPTKGLDEFVNLFTST